MGHTSVHLPYIMHAEILHNFGIPSNVTGKILPSINIQSTRRDSIITTQQPHLLCP